MEELYESALMAKPESSLPCVAPQTIPSKRPGTASSCVSSSSTGSGEGGFDAFPLPEVSEDILDGDASRIRMNAHLPMPSYTKKPAKQMPSNPIRNAPNVSAKNTSERSDFGLPASQQTVPSAYKVEEVRAFARKPRFICFNDGPDPYLNNLMITGSMDGLVQFWSLSQRRISVKFATKVNADDVRPFPEDIAWSYDRKTVCIPCESDVTKKSFLLLFSDIRSTDDSEEISAATKSVHCAIHQKPVRTICSVTSPFSSISRASSGGGAARTNFLTGGDDRNVCFWSFSEDLSDEPSVSVLHNKHTSAVQSLVFDAKRNMVISGGADCKIIMYDLAKAHPDYTPDEFKLRSGCRISNIVARPTDPNTLLLSLSTASEQLALFDIRSKSIVRYFGWPEGDALSKYAAPSWHAKGNYFACGSISSNVVNIWDVRFLNRFCSVNPCGAVHTTHKNRILKSLFHPEEDLLVTCSTSDSSVNFIDVKF